MDNDNQMKSTMDEINMQDNPNHGTQRSDLKKDISDIESNINLAQLEIDQSNELQTRMLDTITPEQANKQKKNIVFMKKDLEKKRTEFEQSA